VVTVSTGTITLTTEILQYFHKLHLMCLILISEQTAIIPYTEVTGCFYIRDPVCTALYERKIKVYLRLILIFTLLVV